MKGTLYGIGVGPGDPGLLTVKAVEIIQKCPVIAVPDAGKGTGTALDIIREYTNGKEIIKCYMPMVYDAAELQRTHQQAAEQLCAFLEHSDVAFATLGDPSVYSTYIYLHRLVLKMGYDARLIPGVPSFCAVGAALNLELCIGDEPLHIIPASNQHLAEYMDLEGTKIIMKSGKGIADVIGLLQSKGLAQRAQMVENCTMDCEKVYKDLSLVDKAGYFSTIVVKEK